MAITTIAVGTDGSATASEAVTMAAELARRFGASLVLISAYQDSQRGPIDRRADATEVEWSFSPLARVRELLARTEEQLRDRGVECRTVLDEGDPTEVLIRLATECSADILVIGNKGMHRRVLGSLPNSVTHKAPCTVMVVKTT